MKSRLHFGVIILLLDVMGGVVFTAQAQGPDKIPPGLDVRVELAPGYFSGDVPIVPSANSSSSANPSMAGPVLLMKSGQVDLEAGTVTLPLHKGKMASGEPVWFVLLDTSDPGMAETLGINYSPKLAYGDVGLAVRTAKLDFDGSVIFERGAVDFSPEHQIAPGTEGPFPPASFQPGAAGDVFYSPLVKLGAHVYNAPMIAFNVEADAIDFCDGDPDAALVHDKVVALCPSQKTVTLRMSMGYSLGRPVFYVTTDTNNEMAAAMEKAIFAPGLADLVLGREDKLILATEPLFAVVNGATGKDNPQRQGFESAMLGEGPPLTILAGIPSLGNDYSPLWALAAGMWTPEAIEAGYRARVTDEFTYLGLVERGLIVGPDGEPVGYTGIIVNCPVIYRVW